MKAGKEMRESQGVLYPKLDHCHVQLLRPGYDMVRVPKDEVIQLDSGSSLLDIRGMERLPQLKVGAVSTSVQHSFWKMGRVQNRAFSTTKRFCGLLLDEKVWYTTPCLVGLKHRTVP